MTNDAKKIAVIIMAAGKGTRMKSDLPKVLHKLAGKTLLSYVIDTARQIDPEKIVVVVGHRRELVEEAFGEETDITFAEQSPQLGTGHAVMCAEEALQGFDGDVVVLSGDVPMLSHETLERLLSRHIKAGAVVSILTALLDKPGSYGRIIRKDGDIVATVEAKDATKEELAVPEINGGIYVFDVSFLFSALHAIDRDNSQGEYYLTDLIAGAVAGGNVVAGMVTDNPSEIEGVNTAENLKAIEDLLMN